MSSLGRTSSWLLLALAALLPAMAKAAVPATPEFGLDRAGDGIVEVDWRMPAGTSVTHHEYRFKEASAGSFPDTWETLTLGATPCRKRDLPPTLPWQQCQATGDTFAKYWTTLREIPNGTRYDFELRAVNNDGAGAAMSFTEALPADPDALVRFEDPVFAWRMKNLLETGNQEVTQLQMARLEWFSFHDSAANRTPETRITSLEGLQYAINLDERRGIDISFHSVTEIPQMAGLVDLVRFVNQGSLLSDSQISHLRNLTNLEQLHLNRGRTYPPPGFDPADGVIRDMSALSGLTKLKQLQVCDQRVNPQHLAPFVNLESMSYCRNDVADVSPLRNMTKMRTLWLFENAIEDISALSAMTELRFLHLQGNLVGQIAPLGALTKLEELHLSDNSFDDVDALVPLVTDGELRIIDLRATGVGAQRVERLRGLTMGEPHPGTSNRNPVVLWDDPPAAPEGLAAAVENGRATLTWRDPGNPGIVSYLHRYRPGPDGEWTAWEWSAEVTFRPTSRRHLDEIVAPDRADRTSWTLARSLDGERHDFELRAAVYSDEPEWLDRAVEGPVLRGADAAVRGVATSSATTAFSLVPSPIDPPQLPVDGGSAAVDLADLFDAAPDGGELTFTAVSSDPAVTAVIEGGELILRAGEGATPGAVVVSVTALDESARWRATTNISVQLVEVLVEVKEASRGFFRGWRIWLTGQ